MLDNLPGRDCPSCCYCVLFSGGTGNAFANPCLEAFTVLGGGEEMSNERLFGGKQEPDIGSECV